MTKRKTIAKRFVLHANAIRETAAVINNAFKIYETHNR